MPDKTRFEREIDEILEKSEGSAKQRQRKRRQFEPFTPTTPKKRPPKKSASIKIDPGYIVILGVIILAVAAFSPAAKTVLALAGAVVLAVGFILWFRTGGSSAGGGSLWARRGGRPGKPAAAVEPEVKYWRGRRIENKPPNQPPQDPDDRGKIIDFGTPDPPRSDDDDKNANPDQGKN